MRRMRKGKWFLCPMKDGEVHAVFEKRYCKAMRNNFACTQPPWHRGNHVACGYATHNLLVWDEKEETNEFSTTKRAPNKL